MPKEVNKIAKNMLKQILQAAIITEEPFKFAKIINVAGRFRKIDFEIYKKVIQQFEGMCKQ